MIILNILSFSPIILPWSFKHDREISHGRVEHDREISRGRVTHDREISRGHVGHAREISRSPSRVPW